MRKSNLVTGICYVLAGLLVVCISMVVFSILGKLEVITCSRLVVLCLFGYLVFQLIAGRVFFYYLLRKY